MYRFYAALATYRITFFVRRILQGIDQSRRGYFLGNIKSNTAPVPASSNADKSYEQYINALSGTEIPAEYDSEIFAYLKSVEVWLKTESSPTLQLTIFSDIYNASSRLHAHAADNQLGNAIDPA